MDKMNKCVICGKGKGVVCAACLNLQQKGALAIRCLQCGAYGYVEQEGGNQFPEIYFQDGKHQAVAGMLFLQSCPTCHKKSKSPKSLMDEFTIKRNF